MSKSTPGPWTVEEYGDDDTPALVIHKDTETRVCFMATPGSHGDPAKIEADANLIAAAPEMLAALDQIEKSITEYLRDRAEAAADGAALSDWDFGEGFGGSIDVIRDAIRKATGGGRP
jgi:hypothetical protein